MCSVVGYIGQQGSREIVLDGLARLEYRGYDSSGFACLDFKNHRLMCLKATGALQNLKELCVSNPIDGGIGIGHTRWSTHGVASQENAHPHFDCHKTLCLVHNGIIENHAALRSQLQQQSHVFYSNTDTEVIAHLLEETLLQKTCTLADAVSIVVKQLKGVYAFVAVLQEYPDVLVVVRKGSPLCIGIGQHEMFVASDVLAFAGKTDKVIFMPDQAFALVFKDRVKLFDFAGVALEPVIKQIDAQWLSIEKDGHEHFMLKEIYEQRAVIHKSIRLYRSMGAALWHQLGIDPDDIKTLKKIIFVACGTSAHAGSIAEFFFEELCGIRAETKLASEFRYRPLFAQPDALYIAISQSGETADTLEAIRFLKEHNQHVVVLTNVASSTMVRESDGFLLTHAGPEIAVASTKAFSTQITALLWLAKRFAFERGLLSHVDFDNAQDDLLVAAEMLETVLEDSKHIIMQEFAPKYAGYEKAIFLGRHIGIPFAQEAALKLKEIAYIFAQAFPAGELKHGPLALIDQQTPVFLFSHPDPMMYQKLLASAQEIKARKGKILAFLFEGQGELSALVDDRILFPLGSTYNSIIVMTGVMQLLMYSIARVRGCEIDKPRNLAKSVTVE